MVDWHSSPAIIRQQTPRLSSIVVCGDCDEPFLMVIDGDGGAGDDDGGGNDCVDDGDGDE